MTSHMISQNHRTNHILRYIFSSEKTLRMSGGVALLFLTLTTNLTYAEKPTAEQALATIGYLSKQTPEQAPQTGSRNISANILHEDLYLFIKKLVLLAKAKDTEKCPDLFELDQQLKENFENITIKLLLDALANAAYIIKNRAEKLCSREEVNHLNDELHRWCDYATGLVNGQSSNSQQP